MSRDHFIKCPKQNRKISGDTMMRDVYSKKKSRNGFDERDSEDMMLLH